MQVSRELYYLELLALTGGRVTQDLLVIPYKVLFLRAKANYKI